MQRILACLLMVVAVPPLTDAASLLEQQAGGIGSVAFHDAVLDQLFATRSEPPSDAVYTIRYLYGDKTEFQLRVSELWESGYHVGRWRVRHGDPTVGRQLARLAEKDPEISVETAAASIAVEYDETRIPSDRAPAKVLQRVRQFRIPAAGLNAIVLHGSLIRFSLRSPGRHLDVRVWASGALDRDKDPFVQWLIDIRAAFESLAFSAVR